MIVRKLFTHDEVAAALAQVAIKERGVQLPPGTHVSSCKLITVVTPAGKLEQARVELELPEVAG